ncbi:hypothetical protein A3F27_01045 [Candidatus Kaiserbacteria bacterium RIFCSPHIGHO2_12_FULL_53_13]|uniref:Uncharacterized protein n=1 Tax=Candidatus Kaiserbacteria bacterium RIFCSPHIGHO2_12_FULL_53_13 TaxID=1798502 RepID=A0A1F6EC16_9BACT|nr:MAG: hypothetical protein A3F27_01045 [Candidatus Kaiserbacteria bacterium RIFCSPHIGHO2_12_FULL_53_13]OGG74548.1 MAG: hypothetical protein A3A37_01620 [Candidatus Kaiserbacteria bacterium RIFCSPLOWO2_01_FULL_52_36]
MKYKHRYITDWQLSIVFLLLFSEWRGQMNSTGTIAVNFFVREAVTRSHGVPVGTPLGDAVKEAVQKYGQPTQPEGVCVFLYSLAGWVPVAQTPENRSLILRAREMVCLIVDNRQGEENYWSV